MFQSMIILIILSLCIGLGVWLVFIWAVKQGEFDDVEGPKFRMLDEDREGFSQQIHRQGEHHDK